MRAALYARFSTDKQRDASIDDQFRECERVAKAAGLEVVARFEDRIISGGTARRPGYQALLTAVHKREFDVIVCEDISRLRRNRAEFGPHSAELEDLGVHCLTCVGDDTRRDGWGLVIRIKQAVVEHARREASYRTRRGLEGKALAGKSTGEAPTVTLPRATAQAVRLRLSRSMPQRCTRAALHRARSLRQEGVPSPWGGLEPCRASPRLQMVDLGYPWRCEPRDRHPKQPALCWYDCLGAQ
jgi:DNA invertase Pin-like site-specific DNA recombinase